MALFDLGRCVATVAAMELLGVHYIVPADLLDRHASGDWGDLSDEDRLSNNEALGEEDRILSAYQIAENAKVWIITEPDRSFTTIMLPDEY